MRSTTIPVLLARRLGCAVLAAALPAQISAIEPGAPQAGTTVRLRYAVQHADATLPADGDVFGTITTVTRSGIRNLFTPMTAANDGMVTGSLQLPDDAVYLHVRFVSRSAHDRNADLGVMVRGPDGDPVADARIHDAFQGGDPARRIEEERHHHPDNFGAYRHRWFLARFRLDDAGLREQVTEDLQRIDRATSPTALWARSYGAMLLGDDATARKLVEQALREHPDAFATARALSDYEYLAYERQLGSAATVRLARIKREVAAACPKSHLARSAVRTLSTRSTFPYAATRAICSAWLADEPRHPEPMLAWANAAIEHEQELDRAARLAADAVNGYLNGDARITGDAHGTLTRMLLPYACRIAARIANRRGQHAEAIGYALMSQRVATRTDAAGFELEARTWSQLGQTEHANRAWLRALQNGSTDARGELSKLYVAQHGSKNGFDANLAERLARSQDGARSRAQPFEGEDLDGNAFALDRLRGKVVVLNFWGLGCAPCKVEIPDLSRLAESFANADVEFLAFASDGEDELRRYLADHPFGYRCVADGGSTAARYRVSSWPTHVVIDKRGRVAATLVGGGKGQDERLRVLIERMLAE